jgi:LPXTG-site transpeptidase (sortase) family protein
LDKLEVGDTVSVLWNGKVYAYVVDASKVVPPTEVSVLNPSKTKILTLFTCTPVFTTKERLVVTARLK